MPNHIAIADAVTSLLNAMTTSPSFTAVRKTVPEADISDPKQVDVYVFPGNRFIDLVSRNEAAKRFEIYVRVRKGIESAIATAARQTEEDGLVGLVEEIEDEIYSRDNMTLANARLVVEEPLQVPALGTDQLIQENLFLSQMLLVYQL